MTANVQYDAQNLREFMARVEDFMGAHKAPLRRVDFANLVTNGTFDSDTTGWTAGSNTTLSSTSGRLRIAHAAGGTAFAYTSFETVLGRHYSVSNEFATDNVTGNSFIYLGTAAAGVQYNNRSVASTTGTYVDPITATVTGSAFITLLNSSAGLAAEYSEWDNSAVWEADPSDDAPWLRLPYGHTVGDYGLIIRDGSVLHPSDYTEITDSGQTFIKPLTAPGAATEFSVFCAPEG